jgi:hypothetical protein
MDQVVHACERYFLFRGMRCPDMSSWTPWYQVQELLDIADTLTKSYVQLFIDGQINPKGLRRLLKFIITLDLNWTLYDSLVLDRLHLLYQQYGARVVHQSAAYLTPAIKHWSSRNFYDATLHARRLPLYIQALFRLMYLIPVNPASRDDHWSYLDAARIVVTHINIAIDDQTDTQTQLLALDAINWNDIIQGGMLPL